MIPQTKETVRDVGKKIQLVMTVLQRSPRQVNIWIVFNIYNMSICIVNTLKTSK